MSTRESLLGEGTVARYIPVAEVPIKTVPRPGRRLRRERANTSANRFAARATSVSGRAEAVVPVQHHAAVALAEREVRVLSDQIAEAESRVGVLRLQRKNLLEWLLRNAPAVGQGGVTRSSDGT